jgi:replication-associated recombination protein RarA
MTHPARDPWIDVKTLHGFPADHVISALQKEIRRGHTENAALLAYEMVITSPALEDYLWRRLQVISVEDVGLGEVTAPVLINSLHQMVLTFDRGMGERQLFAVHAVRYLCGCTKDRSSDEMINWIQHASAAGQALPTIPDYALDRHTAAGQKLGRGRRHFYEEAARLAPEREGRDLTYRDRLLAMLDSGDLAD